MFAGPLRIVMTSAYRAHRLIQKVTRHRSFGVHGVVLTSTDQVVLVRLTYAPGWQLPGGGRKRGESSKDGVLRELREEIGLRAWRSVRQVSKSSEAAAGGASFVIRGAIYQPRWSAEIAEVRAFTRSTLPSDMTPWTKAALARAGVRIRS